MSTRAVYGFKDDSDTHYVYVHHDGYPTGAAEKFARALSSNMCWPLPRFEADEFAAGFVAANKNGSGSVRLTHGPQHHGDIEYYYLLSNNNGVLHLRAFDTPFDAQEKDYRQIFEGTLTVFMRSAEKLEA